MYAIPDPGLDFITKDLRLSQEKRKKETFVRRKKCGSGSRFRDSRSSDPMRIKIRNPGFRHYKNGISSVPGTYTNVPVPTHMYPTPHSRKQDAHASEKKPVENWYRNRKYTRQALSNLCGTSRKANT